MYGGGWWVGWLKLDNDTFMKLGSEKQKAIIFGSEDQQLRVLATHRMQKKNLTRLDYDDDDDRVMLLRRRFGQKGCRAFLCF